MFKTIPLFTIILFVLLGCKEDFPVYSKFTNEQNSSQIKCLNYIIFNNQDKQLLEKSFGIKDDKSCSYKVSLIKYKVKSCTNPIVKSIGSDFNGYIRVEIKKGFKNYYKIQSDYKNDSEKAFKRVLNGISKVFN